MAREQLFSESNYKTLLRRRQKEEVRDRTQLTWKFIAEKLRLQHTYISRSFHREDVHLNEDHLFEILDLLRFDAVEREYILLLRSFAVAGNPNRRAYIRQQIDSLSKAHFIQVDKVKKEATPDETAFLMNPVLMLLYIALHVKKYARNPVMLERVFELSRKQLELNLTHLQNIGMIRFNREKFTVPEVFENSIHFSKDHPLMRGHQQILRHMIAARVARIEEQDKVGFMVSFSAGPSAFANIKLEFFKFLDVVQKHAAAEEGEQIHQLSFDLFKWD